MNEELLLLGRTALFLLPYLSNIRDRVGSALEGRSKGVTENNRFLRYRIRIKIRIPRIAIAPILPPTMILIIGGVEFESLPVTDGD